MSIRDKQVVIWIEEEYSDHSGRTCLPGYGESVLSAIRTSTYKHVNWKYRGIIENIVIGIMWRESRMVSSAIGKYDRLPKHKRSEGLMQIRRDVAALILRRPVEDDELLENVQLNVDLGVKHLLSMGYVQAYNAGQRGMKLKRSRGYVKKVRHTTDTLPWVHPTKHKDDVFLEMMKIH